MQSHKHYNNRTSFDYRGKQDFDDAKNQLTGKPTKKFFLGAYLLIVTLMKEIRPVVTEEDHFYNRDESFSITILWNVWHIRRLKQGQYQWFFRRLLSYKSDALNWDFDCWSQTCNCQKKSVWIVKHSIIHGLYQVFRTEVDSTQETKNSDFSKKYSSASRTVLIET